MSDLMVMSQSAYSKLEKGETAITEHHIHLLAEKIGNKVSTLLGTKNKRISIVVHEENDEQHFSKIEEILEELAYAKSSIEHFVQLANQYKKEAEENKIWALRLLTDKSKK
jgi:transcriptional regulator with XRE-family HTH domain